MDGNWHEPEWGLHPELVEALGHLALEASAHGIAFACVSGARSFHRQALLYMTYRRSPEEARLKYGVVAAPAPMGVSRHHRFYDGRAIACDLRPEAADAAEKVMKLRTLGRLAPALGLVWGGTWSRPDTVHFELASVAGEIVNVESAFLALAKKLDALA